MTITRAQLDQIVANQERAVRRAFFEAIAALRDDVRLTDLVAAIEAGDTERALAVLNITPATFAPLAAAGVAAYTIGGTTGAAQIGRVPASPGGPVVAFRFGGRSPRAERWAADVSSRRIVEIVEDQRALARSVIRSGLEGGRNPRSVALDIVGRIDRATKRRTGGFIGLTEQQGRYVMNLRDELALSPALVDKKLNELLKVAKWQDAPTGAARKEAERQVMANYFTRARRDKRLDDIVSRAMADGVPVKASDIDTIAARYSDRLLQLRGETIARTEAITALRAGQLESMMEAQDQAGFLPGEMLKEWSDTGDGKTRPGHRHADGQKVPVDQPFIVDGYRLMYPGDSRMGAPADTTINCRCAVNYTADFIGRALRLEGF